MNDVTGRKLNKDQSGNPREERRGRLRRALVDAAEQAIAQRGLRSLRARDLADAAGCAVGAIYNAVEDLDELVLLANARTLAALERDIAAAVQPAPTEAIEDAEGVESAVATLVRLAHAYLGFAAANELRWRALFDHRMPGRPVPDWYRSEQTRLFRPVEAQLRVLQPAVPPARHALLARTLFSAVHGIVGLGLEEKLQPIPLPALREQVAFVVTTIGRGMAAADEAVAAGSASEAPQ